MRRALGSAVLVLAALYPTPARAQISDPMGPGAMPGGIPGALPAPPPGGAAPSSKEPETHAAAGGDHASPLPTQMAQLPEQPNAIPPELEGVLGSDFDPERTPPRARTTDYGFYGPYFEEQSGSYVLRGVFPPLWIERRMQVAAGEDRASLFGLSYYQRRSPQHDADVLFPLFWRMRSGETHTTVAGPVMHSESPTGHHNWVAPLLFEGTGAHGTEYLHIPPLLTFHHKDDDGGFSVVGPLFCKWRGGGTCDNRSARELDLGLAPLYFYGRDRNSEYEVIPPLLRYYRYRERGDAWTDVWGPLWREHDREGGVFNVLPLFWHSYGENEQHTTVFPLFHYGYHGSARTIATPLFVDHRAEDGARTFATYLYARHRGRTELDMVTPLFWQYRDPDIQLERTLALPFYYRNVSNRSDDFAIIPFYGHFRRHGISNTHWVTPFFYHETSITGWRTAILPLFHVGRENQSTHLVAAPLLWDFASPSSRQTVVFPFYWRFADRNGLTQVIGNTYYDESESPQGTSWQFHLFPLFSYGETPGGHWWKLLYGLAGYTHDGTYSKVQVAYIPFELSPRE